MEQLVKRRYWLNAIEESWRRRSILWLSGVRRTGKTSLAHSLRDVEYFDCELPRVRRMLEDPEGFLADVKGKRVVLDEIHRLRDPAQVLKIAADHFPTVRILATGSSTLGASRKFRDTLTGRKATVWLTPMLLADLADFRQERLDHRLLRGGLPPFFLAKELPERDFQEWMDAYWAKDIQELFQLERRDSFQRFAELLMARSAGIFQAQKFAKECEVAHGTIRNYLKALEATLVAHVIRPFSTHRSTEIVSAPKTYAFDTGFVCYHRGWHQLRREDLGLLWEHVVLNELQGCLQTRAVRYWRDKHGHEVDFVLAPRGRDPIAIECKWSVGELSLASLRSFRHAYPKGRNFVVAQDADRAFTRRDANLTITVLPLPSLVKHLQSLT
ncbi:MAG: ATP-binding protein [Candidatus Omnitrophica bacterium]|nr:ATP-binding protein [Candidatus Omnitrophota bacterium]MBI2495966.1 ATP-binding protein [Candidatus Omnitrophota bacterium]